MESESTRISAKTCCSATTSPTNTTLPILTHPSPFLGSLRLLMVLAQMINLGLTTTVSTATVNDVRVVYLRNVNFIGNPQGGLGVSLSSLGFNTPWNSTGGLGNVSASVTGVPNVSFNNYSFGVPSTTFDQHNNTFQIIDNVTKIVGTHTFQFGG